MQAGEQVVTPAQARLSSFAVQGALSRAEPSQGTELMNFVIKLKKKIHVTHLLNTRMNLQAYTTPSYFQDDWLNQYHDMLAASESAETSQKAGHCPLSSFPHASPVCAGAVQASSIPEIHALSTCW